VIAEGTRAALTRLVESWAFHEAVLDQGKRLLQSTFLEACISMARLQRQMPQAPVPPNVLGHLDTLAVLLANDFRLRKQIMATLRAKLPVRQMSLLLVVQVSLSPSYLLIPCPTFSDSPHRIHFYHGFTLKALIDNGGPSIVAADVILLLFELNDVVQAALLESQASVVCQPRRVAQTAVPCVG
jgi:hypothetical protein